MKFDPEKHHRRSVRLREFDYSAANAFFVTICSYQKESVFGIIIDGKMNLNAAGECVRKAWLETAEKRSNIVLDEFIVMPNHFHGIIWLGRGSDIRTHDFFCRPNGIVKPDLPIRGCLSLNQGVANRCERFGKPVPGSLPTILRSFKSTACKWINDGRNMPATPVWQRNFYEHIIRSFSELKHTIEYIRSNPRNWNNDEENPDVLTS